MNDVKDCIKDAILYDNAWTFNKTMCKLYVTKEKLYFSEFNTEKNKLSTKVIFNKLISSVSYSVTNAVGFGDCYFVQVNGDGKHQVFYFTFEQEQFADETFKVISSL